VQGRRTEQGNCTVVCNLPLDLDLPEIVASSGGGLCVGCEAEMTSRSEGVEWRVSGQQEEISRGIPGFYSEGCARSTVVSIGRDWTAGAVLLDGAVR
jgi:hypothetical protein